MLMSSVAVLRKPVARNVVGFVREMSTDSQYSLRTKKAVAASTKPIGVNVEAGKTYYWCTCGKSKNQPWCDGSHQGSDFKPLIWNATESNQVYLCACKLTKNAPFCDGTHATVTKTKSSQSNDL
jgi:CDGSH-type Zn-finger protein